MSLLIPHIVLLFVGMAVFYLVMDIALALNVSGILRWVKYVLAVVIFTILASIELYLGGHI